MNKLNYLLLLTLLLIFYSCGNSITDKEKIEDKDKIEINACDEFLAQYEEWIGTYLATIDAYFNNPSDDAVVNRYMELMQEGDNWMDKWDKLLECADNEEYKDRFEEIAKEVEKKLEELGL